MIHADACFPGLGSPIWNESFVRYGVEVLALLAVTFGWVIATGAWRRRCGAGRSLGGSLLPLAD